MSLKVPTTHKHNSNSSSCDDDDITSDLEASFASSMSLYSPTSPAPRQHVPQHLPINSPVPMDISPAPVISTFVTRPRSFGRDLVNTVTNEILARNLLKATPDKPASKLSATQNGTSSNKARQRAALPTQWLQPSTPASVSSTVPMEVDSPLEAPKPALSKQSDPLPNPRKRRSTEPEQVAPPPLAPAFTLELEPPSSSPSYQRQNRKFDRFASSGLLLPVYAAADQERKPRRPALSALVPSSQPPQSAYPILTAPSKEEDAQFVTADPPPRRAFSAMAPSFLPPFGVSDISLSSDGSFGQSSPAAEYAKRNNQRVLRRKDGTEEFRPKNSAGAVQQQVNSSPVPSAMPPFGSEAQGKILPCTSVREDGLMRIDTHVLAKLLHGCYDSEISSYRLFDCRFDYEFAGGHILGATNVSSTNAIEEMLLTANGFLPEASYSGDGKKGKVVLIFHCEFSLHRAPTIAKHLRAKDRAMNNHNYPKVHYPEVYILNGGYSQFFNDYPNFCEPMAYIRMDDPDHSRKCEGGLDNFRKGKWGRTRSYTYGEVHARSRPNSFTGASLAKPPHRNTAPSTGGVPSLFAAANAARSRRGGLSGADEPALAPLVEQEHDHEANTSGSGMESECIEESPCPPTGTHGHRYSTQLMKIKASHY